MSASFKSTQLMLHRMYCVRNDCNMLFNSVNASPHVTCEKFPHRVALTGMKTNPENSQSLFHYTVRPSHSLQNRPNVRRWWVRPQASKLLAGCTDALSCSAQHGLQSILALQSLQISLQLGREALCVTGRSDPTSHELADIAWVRHDGLKLASLKRTASYGQTIKWNLPKKNQDVKSQPLFRTP